MIATFIVRLLTASGELLGWTRVRAQAKPQSNGGSCPFWALEPTAFPIETAGTATQISVHWADLDVARVFPIEPIETIVGQWAQWAWLEPVWLVAGQRDVPLPMTCERESIVIGVPVGVMGARGQ
jgi:hypothetical protein